MRLQRPVIDAGIADAVLPELEGGGEQRVAHHRVEVAGAVAPLRFLDRQHGTLERCVIGKPLPLSQPVRGDRHGVAVRRLDRLRQRHRHIDATVHQLLRPGHVGLGKRRRLDRVGNAEAERAGLRSAPLAARCRPARRRRQSSHSWLMSPAFLPLIALAESPVHAALARSPVQPPPSFSARCSSRVAA